ncbi:MAG TPA: anti-sigma factor [Marmoricola sp.]|nr:anti-sigma factor [Marmoricola sp.]
MNTPLDTPGSIHALSGAYVVDALDDLERARFETHLAGCADCRTEVQGLREAATRLAETTATPPPPALRDRVLADITRVRPLPPEEPTGREATPAPARTTAAHARPRRHWARLLAAAAAVLAIAGVGTVATHPWQGSNQGQLSLADRVLTARDAQRTTATFPGGASATVVRSVSQGRAVIVTRRMPAAPRGKVYELWLQDPSGTMQPAGLMPPGADQTVLLKGDAATAKAVGITVEPAGGSPRPTSTPIAVFDFGRTRA